MNACSLNYQPVRINADAREVHSNKVQCDELAAIETHDGAKSRMLLNSESHNVTFANCKYVTC